jgi:ATP-dependent exoDNAse (exonuclease V) alpha subunit
LQDYAFKILRDTPTSVFLTGRAGTGKSTFLREACEKISKKKVVLAPTGIAAINVRGQTIHSFFKLPFGPILPGDKRLEKIRYDEEKIQLMRKLELLVIDEISMVRADLFDAMDICLRKVRGRAEVFGGVQLLLVGDLLQLEPVVRTEEWQYLQNWYNSSFFFSSLAYRELKLVPIELEKVYRQDDQKFIALLDRVRKAEATYEDLVALNKRPSKPPFDEQEYCVHLSATRASADNTNSQRLAEIDQPIHEHEGVISGDFPLSHLPAEKTLKLKVGAQVIFIRNDMPPMRRWVNGTLAVIESCSEDEVEVLTREGQHFKVRPVEWEHIRYSYDRKKGSINEEVVGTYRQLPLRLAWAVTIHKSQGMSFDRSVVDLGRGAFAAGQTYVALSRCRSWDGLYMRSKIRQRDIIAREEVLKYYQQMNNMDAILKALEE